MTVGGADICKRAEEIWRACGKNISETARRLNADPGVNVSRTTVARWREKHGWETAEAADGLVPKESPKANGDDVQAALTDEFLLSALIRQKARYERYFESLPPDEFDGKALSTYAGILKRIIEIRKETGGFKADTFGRFFSMLIDYLRDRDAAATAVLAKHFDGFAAHLRKRLLE